MEEKETVEEIFEEIVEEKKTLKDMLVEMKDISESIVDLAYSALLTNSKALADVVVELEDDMDKLKYEIEIKAMLASRNTDDARDLTGILHVAQAAELVSNAAKDIADVVQRGEADHPLLISMIQEADETMTKVIVQKKSIMVGKSLGQLELATNTGAYVVAIKRGRKWNYRPTKRFRVNEEDFLIASGSKEATEILEALASGKKRKL